MAELEFYGTEGYATDPLTHQTTKAPHMAPTYCIKRYGIPYLQLVKWPLSDLNIHIIVKAGLNWAYEIRPVTTTKYQRVKNATIASKCKGAEDDYFPHTPAYERVSVKRNVPINSYKIAVRLMVSLHIEITLLIYK